jgi:uncharacterized SAM-binding protein YcdF (DUF218 family)
MASSGTVDEKAKAQTSSAIYGSARMQASNQGRVERLIIGAVTGAAAWMMINVLGAPHIFGIGPDAGLIPLSITGALLSVTRFRVVMPVVGFLLLVAILIISYTGVVSHAVDRFIRVDRIPESADAVVVLSAGLTADGYLTGQGLDRTLMGVTLVEAGTAPVLLFTREERKSHGVEVNNAGDQVRFANLARLNRVLTTRPVQSTRDEAVSVASIARHRGWKRIVLVTSPFHSRRACATFEHVGLAVSCVPSDSRDVAIKRLIDPRDRLAAFGLWLYETAGTLRYRQLGWI